MSRGRSVSGLVLGAIAACVATIAGADEPLPKIAVITTYYGKPGCHANELATRFFAGFPCGERLVRPRVQVASLFIEQPEAGGIGEVIAAKMGVPVYPTITEALTLGGKKLAVDGVLYVGQHGSFLTSRLGARMYPHLAHLDEVFRVFEASGRAVPVFNDKELAYSWLDTAWIHDRARTLEVPLMAGSVVPLGRRVPAVNRPLDERIHDIVGIGYGGLESYAFHVVETVQSVLERRAGGETGVASVRFLSGPAVFEAADAGAFSLDLAEAGCAAMAFRKGSDIRAVERNPQLILIRYRDGTRAAALQLQRHVGEQWGYAARTAGGTVACRLEGDLFSYQALNFERLVLTGTLPHPVERNVLTTGIVCAALESRAAGGREIPTPHLAIAYKPAAVEPIGADTPLEGEPLARWPPEGFEFTAQRRR
ncbi:MAG: hypothetical protein EBZ59_08380 [Planctomycetia bacterium]|nr:hypothetical protein [Planctomycetia bacterium]